MFPQNGSLMETDVHFQSVTWHILRGPQVLPHRAPTERCFVSTALHHLSFKSPGKRTPSTLPNWGPYGESCPFPEPSSHFSRIPE